MPFPIEPTGAAAAGDLPPSNKLAEALGGQAWDEALPLLSSNVEALMTTDLLGSITAANAALCSLIGLSPTELSRTLFKSHFSEPAHAERCLRRVLSDEQLLHEDLVLRTKDGQEIAVSLNAVTLRRPDGKLSGVLLSLHDISEQKAQVEQLRQRNAELTESLHFLHNVLQSATEYAIIAQDLDGQVLSWNEGAQRNYGYTSAEMIGFGNTAWLHAPEDLASGRVQRLFDQALRDGQSEGVFERCHRSGARFTASVSVSLRRDAGGRPLGYLLISRDITEQRRLEEALQRKNEELAEQYQRAQEASRLKTEFLANMSHELRTPLNAIIGFSELMYDGKVGALQPDHREFMGDILNSAHHLLRLINDILDLSKVEAGRMELVPDVLELDALVAELRTGLSALMAQRRILLKVDIDARLGPVTADAGKLKQILYNYLSNAFKFSPEGGEVRLRVRMDGEHHYRIEVEDRGVGIAPSDQPRLFQEFQQLEAGVNCPYPGTGLGLALTKRLVEAQGGRVGVESVYGKGSCFFAVLPIQPLCEMPQAAPIRPAPVAEPSSPRMLVVEGDAERRAWMTSALTGAGYQVDTAVTGAGAEALCRKRDYEVIGFNVRLPDQSGWALLPRLRDLGKHACTPMVALSFTNTTDIAGALLVDECLAWPLAPQALQASLLRAGLDASSASAVVVMDEDTARRERVQQMLAELGWRAEHGSLATVAQAGEKHRPSALLMAVPMTRNLEAADVATLQSQGSAVLLYVDRESEPSESPRLPMTAAAPKAEVLLWHVQHALQCGRTGRSF